MKVIMLAPEFLHVWGGVGSYITELIANLPSSIEVHVIAPYRISLTEEKNGKIKMDYISFGSNVHIHYVSTAKDTFFYNVHLQHAVYRYVPRLIKQERIDILHSHTAHMPDILLRLVNRIKVPVITTIHTTIKSQRIATKNSKVSFSKMSLPEKMTLLLYPILRLTEELYLRREGVYITPSNYMKKWLEHEYPYLSGRIKVIYNAIDTEFWKKSNKCLDLSSEINFENAVIYVGRLLASKGIYDLVKVIPQVLKEAKDTIFIFSGTGEKDKVKLMLRKLGVSERNYMFIGYLPRYKLVKYYNISTVLVLPSYGENMPMTILEAMSCSLPVIATNVGGIPEVIQHMINGILTSPGNLNDLCRFLIMILQDKILRAKLACNARKTIEDKFSWKKIIPQIVQIYEDSLKREKYDL